MADVRSLLRNERASRRLTHPHATYTSSGHLACRLCQIQIKSESSWDSHTASPSHNARLTQLEEARTSKKRKADDGAVDGRKRAKPEASPVPVEQEENGAVSEDAVLNDPTATPPPRDPPQSAPQQPDVDEEEWAAFERDIATPPPQAPPVSGLYATAAISAAPVTAEALAAQAREEQSRQRGRRDEEIALEKEDAAQALEEEFEKMDGLEERVRRLKEQREALSKRRESTVQDRVERVDGSGVVDGRGGVNAVEEESDDADEDEADEWWGAS
ncbi:hypothetical protein LTR50_003032 [Elasticomyces elasticus]|nr:hypothetical protein LTR50_003032 [Elasticomyces elasticus]